MSTSFAFRPPILAIMLLAGTVTAANGAQRSLVQSPPGSAREPAPNIIVSVDDSGSMGASGMATLKAALTQTFSVDNVADGRIRLAWNSMNTCRTISTNGSTPSGCTAFNGIRSLEGTHRTNFLNWVRNGLPGSPSNSNLTPSHQMLSRVGDYLSTTGQYSPYRSDPGSTTNVTELSCRKSFNIFMTDGAWNTYQQSPYLDGNYIARGGGNADGTSRTLPDGTGYTPFSTQTRMYSDNWGISDLSTLSDLAFHYWATDLQPSLSNNVRPSIRYTGTETIGGTALTQYWNPKNNPANWQNMVTYSIGFNSIATNWEGSPDYSTASGMFGGPGYEGLVNGTTTWSSPLCANDSSNPDNTGGNTPCDLSIGKWNARNDYRSSELWHMALNSRGRFVPAPDASSLVTAFQGILADILAQTDNPRVSIASSSSRLRTNGYVYVAGYNSDRWSGDLGAYTITAGTNAVAVTPTWSAATQLDAGTLDVNNRLVLTSTGTVGRTFVWGSLTTAMQNLIRGSDTSTVGSNRVNYLRGDRSQEQQNGGTLRQRDSRLGDIVNSNIWLLGKPSRMSYEHNGHSAFRTAQAARTPTLFVGANDGMLHGFDAATGNERLAYVPLGIYDKLRDYTLPSYSHSFTVDGHPFTGDADLSYTTGPSTTPNWRTVLVSGLGAGARGYFVLDVTTGSYSTNSVLIDRSFSGANGLQSSELDDVGHIFTPPVVDPVNGARSEQIVKLNNGRWAVIMGNGVNSYNERPVLLIQYLDGSRELLRIVANSTTGLGNGLSAPRPVDINGNGTIDIVYAGDLLGNVWKFNLTSATASDWGVSNYSGGTTLCKDTTTCNPLYVAVDASGNRQPITVAPLWMAHPQGGIQVLVGTGINVTDSDRSNTSTQSIYSVWDKGLYSAATSGIVTAVDQGNLTVANTRSSLVTQTVLSAVTTTIGGMTTATEYYNTSQNAVTYSWAVSAAKRGWLMDLPVPRERVVSHPQIYEGQKIIVSSHIPKLGATGETCDFNVVTEDNWINVLNMITGKPSTAQVFTSTDSTLNANLQYATRTRFGSGEYVTINRNDGGADLISLKNDDPTCPEGELCTEKQRLTTGTVPGARADWREVR